MSSFSKTFHWHTMFESIVAWFLGFFKSMVSVDVFEKVIVEFYVSTALFGIIYFSIAQIIVDFLSCKFCGRMKKLTLKWFLITF